jgi:hypothetical protein
MRIFLTIAVLIACGCTQRRQSITDEFHEVHVTALRFMLGRSASRSARSEYSAFVVPKEFARYFSEIRPPVVRDDEKRYLTDTGLAMDRITGKPVMLWSVSKATISGEIATCYVTWWIGNLGAGGHTVSLRKVRGTWIAEREEMIWVAQRPNKAPEPTPGSVTPRAMARVIESKGWNADSDEARGAPAPVVAHL